MRLVTSLAFFCAVASASAFAQAGPVGGPAAGAVAQGQVARGGPVGAPSALSRNLPALGARNVQGRGRPDEVRSGPPPFNPTPFFVAAYGVGLAVALAAGRDDRPAPPPFVSP